MTFLEAVNSGKKVRSQFWDENKKHMDTTLFTDTMDDWLIDMISKTATPLTWKEILGEWYVVN